MRAPLLCVALALGGCREPWTASQLIGNLQSPSVQIRREAAERLCDHGFVPEQAVIALFAAYPLEREPHARGEMLVALGCSGDPTARQLIDDAIDTLDPNERAFAARALRRWLIANGKLRKDQELPDGWPYGQPNFPPPLRDE